MTIFNKNQGLRLLSSRWLAVLVVFYAMTGGASAQSEAEVNLFELVTQKGGIVVYPLFVLSAVAVVMIFFFVFTIRKGRVVSDRFMERAEILMRKKDYLGLLDACNRSGSSVARITEKSVDFMTSHTGVSFVEVREVAEAEGSRQAGMLNSRISYLSDVGSIATMLGLLGTVIGMIQTFMSIGEGNVDGVQQMQVAQGVYPALITTGLGLSIGIVAMIFYAFFRGRVQRYISELESATTQIMATLSAQQNRRQQNVENQRNQRFIDEHVHQEVANLSGEFVIPQGQRRAQAENRMPEEQR